jgi:uncharacterized membrane protein
MESIAKEIEVACPLQVVYNQWTQFEEFPRFMKAHHESYPDRRQAASLGSRGGRQTQRVERENCRTDS